MKTNKEPTVKAMPTGASSASNWAVGSGSSGANIVDMFIKGSFNVVQCILIEEDTYNKID